MDDCTVNQIQTLEKIKPLLQGNIILKKFNEFSMKYQAFDPLNPNQTSMENCGYGLRNFILHPSLTKIEIKYVNKNGLDATIDLRDIMRIVTPKVTQEILKIQKKFDSIPPNGKII